MIRINKRDRGIKTFEVSSFIASDCISEMPNLSSLDGNEEKNWPPSLFLPLQETLFKERNLAPSSEVLHRIPSCL